MSDVSDIDSCGTGGKRATKKMSSFSLQSKTQGKRSVMERMIKGLDKVSKLFDGVALFLVALGLLLSCVWYVSVT